MPAQSDWIRDFLANLTQSQHDWYNTNQDAGILSLFGNIGANNQSPFGAYVRGQSPFWNQQWQAAEGERQAQFGTENYQPLNWMDFLGTLDPQTGFSNLAPRQRGENPGLYAPSVKWLKSPWG